MNSEKHFNKIAQEYDFWKKKNWYYYQNLINLYKEFIPENSNVLEIGCGTGDILAELKSANGVGVDISAEMIKIANQKHKSIFFKRENIFDSSEKFNADYIFLADVMEHVENQEKFIKQISKRISNQKLIISVANPIWEPILMLAEKLKMKMPEGPHYRLSIKKLENIFLKSGFVIKQKGYRLLVPKKIFFSDLINKYFYKLPVINRLGFIIFWILETDPSLARR